jgi:hypothetical protein
MHKRRHATKEVCEFPPKRKTSTEARAAAAPSTAPTPSTCTLAIIGVKMFERLVVMMLMMTLSDEDHWPVVVVVIAVDVFALCSKPSVRSSTSTDVVSSTV